MPKFCQKYVFLISLGLLLPLVPFLVGCNGCAPTPQPKPEPRVEIEQPTVEIEETPEPEVITIVEPDPMPTPDPVPDPVPQAVIPVPKPVIEEPVQPAVEEIVPDEPAVPVRTDSPFDQTPPVNQTSPVEQTPPVNTDSPVNGTSPVQGSNFSLTLFRWLPLPTAILLLQEDEDWDDPEVEEVAPVPSAPAMPPAQPGSQPPVYAQPVQPQPGMQPPPGFQPQPGTQSPPGFQPTGGPGMQPPQQDTLQPGQPPMAQGQRGAMSPDGRGEPPGWREEQPGGRMDRRGGPPGGMSPGSSVRQPAPPPTPSPVVGEPRLEPVESMRISFAYAPWKDVIEWFANQAALTVHGDKMPTGTFNYRTDGRSHTPEACLDILNSHLQFKDYSLIRRGRTLFVIYLPDGIPANLLTPLTPEELDSRGEYEISRVIFNLDRTPPATIQTEIERLLGPQGSVVPMERSQQIVITETGGTLRKIREIIQRIDDPDNEKGTVHMVEVKNVTAEEALQHMRTLLAIDAADVSLRTSVDPTGKKILLAGRDDRIRLAKDAITRIDESLGSDDPTRIGDPQFATYDVGFADPATVFSVLQTLLAGTSDVRLSLDPRTNGILLRGRPAVHATVRAAIEEMQLNAPQIDIIPLVRMSPLTAVERIKSIYPTATSPAQATTTQTGGRGGGGQGSTTTTPAAQQPPTVEADTMARRIIVRGTLTQIKEIRGFLASLGEDGNRSAPSSLASARSIPVSPAAAALVLEQLQNVLPRLDPNIKVNLPVLAPEPEPALAPERQEEPLNSDELDGLIDDTFQTEEPELLIIRLMRMAENPVLAQVLPVQPAAPQAEVNVMLTPGGFVITSNDPDALDKLEELIHMLSDESVLGRTTMEVYYLKYTTAAVVSTTLNSLMGTTAAGGVSGVASVDLPEWQRSEMLGLIGAQPGAVEKTGVVSIATDARLNALFVQANAIDHKTVARLLKIIDQPARDDILRNPAPRFIVLHHMPAAQAKTSVEVVFAEQLQGSRGGQQQQRGQQQQGQQPVMMMGPGGQPLPPQFQAMLGAMQGAAGSRQNQNQEQEPQMRLDVQPETNALIVSASASVFEQVEAYVKELDRQMGEQVHEVATVQLLNITPAFAQQSLANLVPTARVTSNQLTAQPGSGFGGMGTMTGMGGMGTFGGQQRAGMGTIGGGMGTMGAGMMGCQQRAGMGTIGGGTFGGQQRPTGTIGGGMGTMGGGAFGGQQRPTGTIGGGTMGGTTARPGGTTGGALGGATARPAGR